MKEYKLLAVKYSDWEWKNVNGNCDSDGYALYYMDVMISKKYILNDRLLIDKFDELLNKYASDAWIPFGEVQFKSNSHVIQNLYRNIE